MSSRRVTVRLSEDHREAIEEAVDTDRGPANLSAAIREAVEAYYDVDERWEDRRGERMRERILADGGER